MSEVPANIHEQFAIAKAEEAKFELALGRYVLAWADVESELYRVLLAYSKVSDAVGRAIFSGTRASTIMKFIEAIAHNTNMPKDRREDLAFVFPQIAAINTMRDRMLHYGSQSYSLGADPRTRVLSNSHRASRYDSYFIAEVGVGTLEAMTHDLHRIHNHLNYHWGEGTHPFSPWQEEPDEKTTWSFRPPQPATKATKRASGQRERAPKSRPK